MLFYDALAQFPVVDAEKADAYHAQFVTTYRCTLIHRPSWQEVHIVFSGRPPGEEDHALLVGNGRSGVVTWQKAVSSPEYAVMIMQRKWIRTKPCLQCHKEAHRG